MPSSGDPRVELLDALKISEQAVRLEFLTEIAHLDRERMWVSDGATSMSDWLAGRYSTSISTAREWLKVAHALLELPRIRDLFAEGRLSWDQLRALIRYVTPQTEAEWAERAPDMTVSELRAVNKTVSSQDVVDTHQQRQVAWWFDGDRPEFHMTVQMADIEGATLATWLTRRANQYDPDPQTGLYEDFQVRCADALYELASQALAADGDHDLATILIHTNLTTLLDGIGTASIADGPALANDTLRRLACDARLQLALTGTNREVIGVGRTTRTIPSWLKRLVQARDQGCRFPTCQRTRWTQIHHIIHWADGGPTNLDNLVTLCGFHHRLIHEHGWTIKGNPNRKIIWHHPYGTPFEPQPPRHPPHEWKRILNNRPPIRPPKRLPTRQPEAVP